MKSKPILFSAPMVRALLNGSKTQTRRVVKLHHENSLGVWEATTVGGKGIKNSDGSESIEITALWHTRTGDVLVCKYGYPGDQLWVKETWRTKKFYDHLKPSEIFDLRSIQYKADDPKSGFWYSEKWRSPLFMQERFSRITLEITGIRVERLNDCSEADAIAEGILRHPENKRLYKNYADDEYWYTDPIASYRSLWESINGVGSWAANPWVWVVEFPRYSTGK